MPESLASLWEGVLASLSTREDVTLADIGFLRLAKPLGIIDDTMLIAVPSALVKERIETRLEDPILEGVNQAADEPIQRFAVTIDPSLEDSQEEATEPPAPLAIVRDDPEENVRTIPPRLAVLPTPLQADPARLNPKYTFETFVIGPSNRFANAAARAVAEAPARAYNPLFIYGGSGLGKTHLLHAIGHYARQIQPDLRVKYVSSEEFTNDFINSIRDKKAESFHRRYRNVDLLLVDDIQFLGGKEQTVEEFFHTFNALHNDLKQVVITSDTPPKKLQGFEERLISRFEWGLLTDVQPPDLETRIAILSKKAHAENLHVTHDVLTYIADRISTNIRELEGALIRVTAFANLNQQPVDQSLAALVLRDLVTDADLEEITPALIMKETANYFSIPIEALTSADRSRIPASARQIAMYLCRELTELSLPKIGQTFGGRDHTTVMYACRKITEQMGEKHAIYNQVTEITSRIKQQARNLG